VPFTLRFAQLIWSAGRVGVNPIQGGCQRRPWNIRAGKDADDVRRVKIGRDYAAGVEVARRDVRADAFDTALRVTDDVAVVLPPLSRGNGVSQRHSSSAATALGAVMVDSFHAPTPFRVPSTRPALADEHPAAIS
jgi:hypothetical protein